MAARRLAIFLGSAATTFVITKRTDPLCRPPRLLTGCLCSGSGRADGATRAWKMDDHPFAMAALFRRRADYDVICVIDYRGIGLAAILAGRILNRPVIIQAQTEGVLSCTNWAPMLKRVGLRPESAVARALSWPLRRAYRAADAFACISRTIEKEALAEGVRRHGCITCRTPSTRQRFRPATAAERSSVRERNGWPADSIIAIFVGRLSREKGVMDLLQAWERVSAEDTAGGSWARYAWASMG